jgi:hypothetical protein
LKLSQRRTHLIALASIPLIGLAACVSDGPQPPDRPQPRQIATPSGLSVHTVVLAADQYPADSDNNGFVDTFNVNVFLFPRSDEFPLPIHVDGTMSFELLDSDERPIVEWVFTEEQVRQVRTRPLPGPSHQFQLSLLEKGNDRYRPTRTQLRATFNPADGDPVVANGRPTVNIGPVGTRR